MSDLLVTPYAPTLGSGRAMRTYGIVRALAALGPVDLLYVPFGAAEPAQEFRAIEALRLHRVCPSRGPRRALFHARARLGGAPGSFARGASPELAAEAERLASAPGRGRVIADGPSAAVALAGLARRRPVIYNAHNLESAFRSEIDSDGASNGRRLEAFERQVLGSASEAWMVSASDMEGARRLAPRTRIRYVPNVVDVSGIEPVSLRPTRRRALFVADFTYAPNRTALRFLLDEVLPLVWHELPDARLDLAGRGFALPDDTDGRVRALGFVEDLAAVYAAADCAVVPLVHGGGSPLKFIEGLAYGLPVVATPRAAAGLEAVPGEHFLEGHDAPSFATALAYVLRSGAPEVARRGRELVEQAYSIEGLASRIAA